MDKSVSKHKQLKACHQGENFTFLVMYLEYLKYLQFLLEYLEFKYFSVFHHRCTLKSIWPTLPNLALICAALHRKL